MRAVVEKHRENVTYHNGPLGLRAKASAGQSSCKETEFVPTATKLVIHPNVLEISNMKTLKPSTIKNAADGTTGAAGRHYRAHVEKPSDKDVVTVFVKILKTERTNVMVQGKRKRSLIRNLVEWIEIDVNLSR